MSEFEWYFEERHSTLSEGMKAWDCAPQEDARLMHEYESSQMWMVPSTAAPSTCDVASEFDTSDRASDVQAAAVEFDHHIFRSMCRQVDADWHAPKVVGKKVQLSKEQHATLESLQKWNIAEMESHEINLVPDIEKGLSKEEIPPSVKKRSSWTPPGPGGKDFWGRSIATDRSAESRDVQSKSRNLGSADLPIANYRTVILDALHNNKVTIIRGGTGCGKSTQVPQIILDSEPGCQLLVSQPRKVAARSLADRVADERGETRLGISVGLCVGMEDPVLPCEWPASTVVFGTTEALSRRLRRGAHKISHVIVDEVHERSLETDFLLAQLRQLLLCDQSIDLRVVLMSATIDMDAFCEYFHAPRSAVIDVEGCTFPVERKYLEDVIKIAGPYIQLAKAELTCGPEYSTDLENKEMWNPRQPLKIRNGSSSIMLDQSRLNVHVIAGLVRYLQSGGCGSSFLGAILVFLPGEDAINKTYKELVDDVGESNGLDIHILNGSCPDEQQRQICSGGSSNGYLRVILASNIAETSVTIPDVDAIIDTGLHRTEWEGYPLMTEWVSQQSVKQRCGRVGRVRPGRYYALFTEDLEKAFKPRDEPEIMRSNLLSVTLKSLSMNESPEDFLATVIEPPDNNNVRKSLRQLQDMKLATSSKWITSLGKIVERLPLVPNLGKSLVVSQVFGMQHLMARVVAVVSNDKNPWRRPSAKVASKQGAQKTEEQLRTWKLNRAELASKCRSDVFALAYLLAEYEFGHRQNQLCEQYGLDKNAMHRLKKLAQEYENRLPRRSALPRVNHISVAEGIEKEWSVLSALLFMGMHENVASLERSIVGAMEYPIKLGCWYSGSCKCRARERDSSIKYWPDLQSGMLVFFAHGEYRKPHWNCSNLSAIDSLSLLLCATNLCADPHTVESLHMHEYVEIPMDHNPMNWILRANESFHRELEKFAQHAEKERKRHRYLVYARSEFFEKMICLLRPVSDKRQSSRSTHHIKEYAPREPKASGGSASIHLSSQENKCDGECLQYVDPLSSELELSGIGAEEKNDCGIVNSRLDSCYSDLLQKDTSTPGDEDTSDPLATGMSRKPKQKRTKYKSLTHAYCLSKMCKRRRSCCPRLKFRRHTRREMLPVTAPCSMDEQKWKQLAEALNSLWTALNDPINVPEVLAIFEQAWNYRPSCKLCCSDLCLLARALCSLWSALLQQGSTSHSAVCLLIQNARVCLAKQLSTPEFAEEVKLKDVRFTHHKVSPTYRHGLDIGRKVTDVALSLRNGSQTPKDPNMVLDAVFFHGKWRSLNNRHLKALKLAQQWTCCPGYLRKTFPCYVRSWPLTPGLCIKAGQKAKDIAAKFYEAMSSRNDGRFATIRSNARAHRRHRGNVSEKQDPCLCHSFPNVQDASAETKCSAATSDTVVDMTLDTEVEQFSEPAPEFYIGTPPNAWRIAKEHADAQTVAANPKPPGEEVPIPQNWKPPDLPIFLSFRSNGCTSDFYCLLCRKWAAGDHVNSNEHIKYKENWEFSLKHNFDYWGWDVESHLQTHAESVERLRAVPTHTRGCCEVQQPQRPPAPQANEYLAGMRSESQCRLVGPGCEVPPRWGAPSGPARYYTFRETGSKSGWYCHLCEKWADYGHPESSVHTKRSAYPDYWLQA